jgi:hypothetical protein
MTQDLIDRTVLITELLDLHAATEGADIDSHRIREIIQRQPRIVPPTPTARPSRGTDAGIGG